MLFPLFPPRGSLVLLIPGFVELGQPSGSRGKVRGAKSGWDLVGAGRLPVIAFEQERFCLGKALLPEQAGADLAQGSKPLPVVRSQLDVNLQALAEERFRVGRF